MRNDLLLKITLIENNDVDELYFDYYNRLGVFVGNVIVTSQGKIEWHIINAAYQNNIFNIILYINGANTKKYLDYIEENLDTLRWIRAGEFITNNGLFINNRSIPFEVGKVLRKR